MQRTARWLTWLLAGATVLVACGDDAAEVAPEQVLAQALSETAEATSYRFTQSAAQTISLAVLGLDSSTEIDPDRPVIVGEVTPGSSHFTMDFAAILGPLLPAELGPIRFEMWQSAEALVIDTRGFQSLAEFNRGADLGPFAPGLALVDLEALASEAGDLVAAIAGSGPASLGELARRLPPTLTDVRQIADQPLTFAGSATFAAYTEAIGGDLEVQARSTAGGLALSLDVDVDALTQVYVDYYDISSIDVVVEIDGTGLATVVSTSADLSEIFEFILAPDNAAALGIPERARNEAIEAFADAVWIIETRAAFTPDADLVVDAPPPATEDRTEQWRDFLVSSGFGS